MVEEELGWDGWSGVASACHETVRFFIGVGKYDVLCLLPHGLSYATLWFNHRIWWLAACVVS